MDQENIQTAEEITYFVVFNRQPGELKPAYSYMNKTSLEEATQQGIIAKAYIVPTRPINTPEDTAEYLNRFLNETTGGQS